MPTSNVIPVFAHNSTAKAWCVTSNHTKAVAMTQREFDDMNFIDGYNLRLDVATQNNPITGVLDVNPNLYYTGALKFSFIKPMTSPDYKVFVCAYGYGPGGGGSLGLDKFPQLAHVLNSSVYPKTNESFWIRLGFFANANGSPRPTGSGRSYDNQVVANKLWSSGVTRIGVVVI